MNVYEYTGKIATEPDTTVISIRRNHGGSAWLEQDAGRVFLVTDFVVWSTSWRLIGKR